MRPPFLEHQTRRQVADPSDEGIDDASPVCGVAPPGSRAVTSSDGLPPASGRMLSPVLTYDALVLVVDDDRQICEALTDLLSTYDLQVVTFGSAAEYNAYAKPDVPACLLLDVDLPDVNGFELMDLTGERTHTHVDVFTGY